MDIDSARKLLIQAGLMYSDRYDDIAEWNQTLNLNDVWSWGSADGTYVPDEDLPRVAELFYKYGWNGIIWWAAKKEGIDRSEFHHYNRGMDFVDNEEAIAQKFESASEHAYYKTKYCIGEE